MCFTSRKARLASSCKPSSKNHKILLAGDRGIGEFPPLTRRSLVKPVLPQHSRRLNISVNLNQWIRKGPRRKATVLECGARLRLTVP